MAAIPEVEYLQDAKRYSALCEQADKDAIAEMEAVKPVEHICAAIRQVKLTDAQLKRLITVLANQADASGCHEMAVAGLDDTGELL